MIHSSPTPPLHTVEEAQKVQFNETNVVKRRSSETFYNIFVFSYSLNSGVSIVRMV